MGKGSSSTPSTPTSQTVTQTNIPDYASPYYLNLLSSAQTQSQVPYQTYPGQQIAPLNDTQNQAFQGITALPNQTAQPLAQAGQNLTAAGNYAQNFNYDPSTFTSQNFDASAANQYMSPYISNVVDAQNQLAQRQFNEGQSARDFQAKQMGAFSNSDGRQIGNQLAARDINQQEAASTANLLNTGYTNAQGQFNADQQRSLAAQQLGEQSNQFGATAGLQAGLLGLQSGAAQAGLANTANTIGSAQQNALLGVGTLQQQNTQNQLTNAYTNFQNQVNYPNQQLQLYSSLLRGVPVTANQNVTTTAAPPSPISNLLGLGIGGLGLSQALGSGATA